MDHDIVPNFRLRVWCRYHHLDVLEGDGSLDHQRVGVNVDGVETTRTLIEVDTSGWSCPYEGKYDLLSPEEAEEFNLCIMSWEIQFIPYHDPRYPKWIPTVSQQRLIDEGKVPAEWLDWNMEV